ncbi:ATP-binding cassette domain-containing protein [Methanobrevibacter cuticularis]|uniref:ATP-binding cassette domain-containing protein n=1 Tax=Methanobrevibacter cuticularis TaxID=47311 RepID=UPI001B800189|nr:ATP-binding cassette domain-containing protein [Methanobrevibacter cuticularis]
MVKIFDKYTAVDKVDLSVPVGSIYGLVGPNGAGKTTIINMLATLSQPNAGTIKVFGYDAQKEAHAVRQLIGLTGQFASIDENLSALENLIIFGKLLGLSGAESKKRAYELLEDFGLKNVAKRSIEKFSGGMRRRIDLAVSLILEPPLIFLDEPTTGLDPRTRAQMWKTIRKLVKKGSTILLTTQYLDEADQLADRIMLIDHGKVAIDGTPDQLKDSIGAESLQLTVRNIEKVHDAVKIVKKILDVEVQLLEASNVTAPLNSPDKLVEILNELNKANIDLSGIQVRRPTLDDVFMALTGESIEEENKKKEIGEEIMKEEVVKEEKMQKKKEIGEEIMKEKVIKQEITQKGEIK